MSAEERYELDCELLGEPPPAVTTQVVTVEHLDAVLDEIEGWLFVGFGSAQRVTASGKVEHATWSERSFRWPAQRTEIAEAIADGVKSGADVYFTPSLSENPVRKLSASVPGRKEATRKPRPVSALWADLDAEPHPGRTRQLVNGGAWRVASGSAPDRHHLYLPLVEPADPDVATDLLERLAAYLGADPSVARHGAYLRPAGTLNHKPDTLGSGPPGSVHLVDQPCEARWTVDMLDDLLPPVEHAAADVAAIPTPEDVTDVNDPLAAAIAEKGTDGMDRSKRSYRATAMCIDAGLTDGQALTLMRRHEPTVAKFGDRLDVEVTRALTKIRGASATRIEPTPAGSCTLADTHGVFRRWFGDEFDLDVITVALVAAAVERLDGDPLWVLVISGSGAAKTESVQALIKSGAIVTSTITSVGALLSASPKKEKAKDATGGLLRRIGPRGVLVIKDVTSILSMDRHARGEVLAAMREVYDGLWERNVGTDGGRTLTWRGRLAVIGAVTTAWDRAHDVIASMGDRFVLIRSDSTEGRIRAGQHAIGNTGSETTMRTELAEAAAGVLSSIDPGDAIDLDDDEIDRLLSAADVVTLARTGVDYDYRGDVIDAHAPEMPTRFAKQLAQVVRGSVAIGMDRVDGMRLAIRCARDSMPPMRLTILLDVAAHPGATTTEVRKRIDKPRSTVDRQLQSLHMLGLLVCDEDDADLTRPGSGRWRYRLADGIDPDVLTIPPTVTRKVTDYTQAHQEEGRAGALPTTHKSGDGLFGDTTEPQ